MEDLVGIWLVAQIRYGTSNLPNIFFMMQMFIMPSIYLLEEIMISEIWFFIVYFVIQKSIQKTQISAPGEM